MLHNQRVSPSEPCESASGRPVSYSSRQYVTGDVPWPYNNRWCQSKHPFTQYLRDKSWLPIVVMNWPSTLLSSRLTYARFGPLFSPSFLTSSDKAVVRTSDMTCASSLLLLRHEFRASEKFRRWGWSRNTPTLGTQVWFVLAVTI